MFEWFSGLELQSPTYVLHTFEHGDNVKDTIRKIFDAVDDGSPSDGVVVELNDLNILPTINGKYKSTQAAIKVDKWGLTSNSANQKLVLESDGYVIPDFFVVCDRSTVKRDGVYGVPFLVVEVLSSSTSRVDRGLKKTLYQNCGVQEYWLVEPDQL